jgi:DNA-binding transcriptional MerR regulator
MKKYTQEEINEISAKCLLRVNKVLKEQQLSVGHVDHIIDNLMSSFTANSLMNIPLEDQRDYLESRLKELSEKLARVCEIVHKMKCNDCKEEKPEGVTIH